MRKVTDPERLALAEQTLRENADAVSRDYHRLAYHFMPPSGWMNDPNGFIRWKGEYHLFYQHNPMGPEWDFMYWGHAKSRDLVHWEHLPLALAPFEPYDKDGCFSGTTVDVDGILTAFYTGVLDHPDGTTEQSQCMAASEDGINFEKHAGNPVLPRPPQGYPADDFRDPKVFMLDGTWHMIVGSSNGERGVVLLFRSGDLIHWNFAGQLAENHSTKDKMWECPDLLRFKERWALFESRIHEEYMDNIYFSGTIDFDAVRFHETASGKLDWGVDYYAAQTIPYGEDAHLAIAWMDIWNKEMPSKKKGWAGAITLPRVVRMQENGELRITPAPELQLLRETGSYLENVALPQRAEQGLLEQFCGDQYELITDFDLSGPGEKLLELYLRRSPDGKSYTLVSYDSATHTLSVDRNHAGEGEKGISTCELIPDDSRSLRLHIFMDHSSLEVFAEDGKRVMTHRIFPAPDCRQVSFCAAIGRAALSKAAFYPLKSIW